MLRRRWCLLLRLRWYGGVHWIILIIYAKWTSHRRINSTSHARNAAHWRRLFGWRHLQNTRKHPSEMRISHSNDLSSTHLKTNASVEWKLNRIRMVACLHQCRKMTDANLLERRFSSSSVLTQIRQTLTKWIRTTQQDIATIDLFWKREKLSDEVRFLWVSGSKLFFIDW